MFYFCPLIFLSLDHLSVLFSIFIHRIMAGIMLLNIDDHCFWVVEFWKIFFTGSFVLFLYCWNVFAMITYYIYEINKFNILKKTTKQLQWKRKAKLGLFYLLSKVGGAYLGCHSADLNSNCGCKWAHLFPTSFPKNIRNALQFRLNLKKNGTTQSTKDKCTHI